MEPKVGQVRFLRGNVFWAVVLGIASVLLKEIAFPAPLLFFAAVLLAISSAEICRNVIVKGTWQDNTSFEVERKVWKPYLHWTVRVSLAVLALGLSLWLMFY